MGLLFVICFLFTPLIQCQQRHLRIGVIQSEPFLRDVGGQFEGFIVDLVSETSVKANFSYDFIPSVDNRYGTDSVTGSWNGLVGMLLRNEIDCIAADLTVTAARLSVMDFSKPFMSSSITFLLQDSLYSVYSLGSWFKSYSAGVWILLLVSYVISALSLYCVSKISPIERGYLSVSDAFWHLIACCIRGSKYKPFSISGRLISCCWWMFYITFIIIYFVFISGHITAEMFRVTQRYSTVQQVLDNVNTLGVVTAGSTLQMLQNSENPTHQAIWKKISSNPSSLVDNYISGLQMVDDQEGAGAMLMEATAAQYIVAQECNKYTGKLGGQTLLFCF